MKTPQLPQFHFRKAFKRIRYFAFFGLVALAVWSVWAVTTIQTPSWSAPGPIAATSSCGTLAGPVNSLTTGSGTARFVCSGTPATGAFTVTTAGSDTPTFTLPAGQTSLGYVGHAAVDCSTEIVLTSSSAVQLSAGSYDLCIGYSVTQTTTFAAGTALSWST
jgi:hypothetical protein